MGKKKKINENLEQVLDSNLDATGIELALLQIRLRETTTRLNNPLTYFMSIPQNERSLSPEPIYDQKGQRLNSREFRICRKLTKVRNDILIRMLELNPNFKTPGDWKRPNIEKRIFIPINEYPDYNFLGLILGPGGSTHKKLQKESNCKIAIRGKGAHGNKINKIPQPDDHMPMHIFISGSEEASVKKAESLIKDLLTITTETENETKAKQFRQLALIHGTMSTITRCRICGGAGHPVWTCPERTGDRWTPANVQCIVCGELSHVTEDCKLTRGWNKKSVKMNINKTTIEDEYSKFMKELNSNRDNYIGPVKPIAALTNIDLLTTKTKNTVSQSPSIVSNNLKINYVSKKTSKISSSSNSFYSYPLISKSYFLPQNLKTIYQTYKKQQFPNNSIQKFHSLYNNTVRSKFSPISQINNSKNYPFFIIQTKKSNLSSSIIDKSFLESLKFKFQNFSSKNYI